MIVESSAPTRVDLAGGTVDIWPLYLFHEGSEVVNFAIDLTAKCRIETGGTGYTLVSKDTGATVRAETLDELRRDRTLELVARLVAHFKPEPGITVTTASGVPPGSGLGGSSALGIAVSGALDALVGTNLEREKLRETTTSVETQVIRVPAGLQDYYPALYGGLNSLRFDVSGVTVSPIPLAAEAIERRFVLAYTGVPHFSGTNNWEIFKARVDGDEGVVDRLGRISATAEKMRAALVAGDLEAAGKILGEEWENRRALASGVSTPVIEELVGVARAAGSPAAKVCGAGGGGCVIFYCDEGRKADVDAALRKAGATVLDYRVDTKGLTVTKS